MEYPLERLGIFFLHGFLGIPSDWNPVFENVAKTSDRKLYPVNYFHEPSLGPETPLAKWGEVFNEFVLAKGHKRNILVGYSLGGRLALQALEQSPSLWTHAIFVSTNTGFADTDEDAREERLEKDETWAERFVTSDWKKVLAAWNKQPVFTGSKTEPIRIEKDYNKTQLSQALTNWSLAEQPDMRTLLKLQFKKITWISGANDRKFLLQSETLKRDIPGLRSLVIEQASHRLIFDQPQSVAKAVCDLLK